MQGVGQKFMIIEESPDVYRHLMKFGEQLLDSTHQIAEELLELNYNLKPRHTKFYFLNNMERLA